MNEKKKKEKRFLVEAISKAAKEQGVNVEWMSGDWVCILEKEGFHQYIYGYAFPLNSASSCEIARDKTATSEILKRKNIPCVDHKLFLKPEFAEYVSDNDQTTEALVSLANTWQYPVVIKDNRGAAGNYVFKVENENQLIESLKDIWSISRGAALSPYQDIKNEYRCFVLNGEIIFAYKKIPQAHEWKFNLNRGGEAELININDFPEMKKMALDSAHVLKLNLCSVDIIQNKNKNDFLVLEVNTSITTEYFSQTSEEAMNTSQELYSKIISSIFRA